MSDKLYPIAIIQDRYSGVYSGGQWLAIANSKDPHDWAESRAHWCLHDGPHGNDITASVFGLQAHTFDWIGVGNTPDEAVSNLKRKNY